MAALDAYSFEDPPTAATPATPAATGKDTSRVGDKPHALDQYDFSEDPTDVPEVAGAPASAAPQGEDLGAGSAFIGKAISGIPIVGPSVRGGMEEGLAWLRSKVSGKSLEEERANIAAMSGSTEAAHKTASTAGEITGQIGGYVAAAALAPEAFGIGMALPRAVVASGATNALISGADAYMRGQDPVKAAEAGGVLGMAAPVIGTAVTRLFSNYIRPEVARLANRAINDFGIPLGPDLLTTNPMLRFASSVVDRMPLSGGQAAVEARQVAFNRAVAAQMGENAERLTPEVMARARTRIRGQFEYAADNTPRIGADRQFGNDLTSLWDEIRNPVDRALTADERGVMQRQFRNVLDQFRRGNGSITGRQYQQMTRRGTMLDRATESDNPNIAHYASRLEDILNDALMRNAPADAADALRGARAQWWAMKTIAPLAQKAPTGNISPALLTSRMGTQTGGEMAFGGGGDLGDLARIGSLFLKEPGSSGTAERTFVMKLITELGSTGALWYLFHHPLGGALGFVLPAIVGRTAASVARSPRLGNALVRSAIGAPGPIVRAAQGAARIGRTAVPGIVQQARPYLPGVPSLIGGPQSGGNQ